MMSIPDALHRTQADPSSLCHGSASPMCDLPRRLGTGQRQDPRHGNRRQLRRARRACLVAEQCFYACFGIPYLPAPHRWAAYPGLTGYLGHGQSLARQQHDPGTLDEFLRTVSICGFDANCFRSLTPTTTQLTEPYPNLAEPCSRVNRSSASVH